MHRRRYFRNFNLRNDQTTWLVFVVVISFVTAVMVLSGTVSPLRTVLVFGYMLFVPGWSFVRLLRLYNPAIKWALAVTLSMSIVAVIAMLLMFFDAWSASLGMLLTIAVSIGGSLIRYRGRQSHDRGARIPAYPENDRETWKLPNAEHAGGSGNS
jgi:uncharacterized membrane protein